VVRYLGSLAVRTAQGGMRTNLVDNHVDGLKMCRNQREKECGVGCGTIYVKKKKSRFLVVGQVGSGRSEEGKTLW